jgi:hypothetical protein
VPAGNDTSIDAVFLVRTAAGQLVIGRGTNSPQETSIAVSTDNGASFGPVKKVTDTGAYASAVVAGGDGVSHLALDTSGGNTVFQTYDPAGGAVTAKAVVFTKTSTLVRTALAFDGARPLGLLDYDVGAANQGELLAVHKGGPLDETASWAGDQPVGKPGTGRLAAGPKGTFRLQGVGTERQLSRFNGTGFDGPAAIPFDASSSPATAPQDLAQDTAGGLHAAWRGPGASVCYAYSPDGGASWDGPRQIADGGFNFVRVAARGNGDGVVVGGVSENANTGGVKLAALGARVVPNRCGVPPLVTTGQATPTATTAMLGGSVAPRGQLTSYRFEYGTTTGYGTSTPVGQATGAERMVSEVVGGLAPNTTYQFRIVGSNASGEVQGANGTFRTAAGTQPEKPEPPFQPNFNANPPFQLPSSKKCVSRRKFRIRVKRVAGVQFVSAAISVNGKRVRTVKRDRIYATVNLRGLPKGRFRVTIKAKTSTGRTATFSRRYRTCAKKR